MKTAVAGLSLLFATIASAPAGAAGAGEGVRYLPEIFGRLAGASGYEPVNVCLRRKGSEITQCAYTDSGGRFRLPSFGEVHRVRDGDADWHGAEYPEYWLEVGTRTKSEKRLWTVELVDRKRVAVRLDCDPARTSKDGAAPVYCERERRAAP